MANLLSNNLTISDKVCAICRDSLAVTPGHDSLIQLTPRGLETLLHFSDLHGDNDLQMFLASKPAVVNVHVDCRKKYTSKRRFEQQQKKFVQPEEFAVPPTKQLRSSLVPFDWQTHCFFCCQTVLFDSKHPDRYDGSLVRTIELRDNVLTVCEKRNDSWGLEVQSRLNTCCDLVAADATYHRGCMRRFMSMRSSIAEESGRKKDIVKAELFEQLCEWLETADDLYTVSELHEKLQELAGSTVKIYSEKWLQQMLVDKYKDHIFFAQISGRNNVVCFKDVASTIISDKWYADRKSNIDDESERIVIAAAKLIKAEIRNAKYSMESYPLNSHIGNLMAAKDWLPSLLTQFMQHVVSSELKHVALSHCIVQAARPRSVISPVLLAVGVSMDHVFGSRWLIETLARLGISVSYDEVNVFKQSCVQSSDVDEQQLLTDAFVQWSADNIDHNVITLDGSGTFHGMGIISMTTPCSPLPLGSFCELPLKRMPRARVSSVVQHRGIAIINICDTSKSSLSSVKFKPFRELSLPIVTKPSINLDLVWHTGWFLADKQSLRPNWSGFMQNVCVTSEQCSPAASIKMLPIIDVNPNDRSCIYSSLYFVQGEAKRLNMQTACITFDQPLWLKAVEIVKAYNMNVVCRLGAFHIQMSFLGSIGSIMAGSGLDAALQTCYGPTSIIHMLSGKAVARAVRGHFIVESALTTLMLQAVFNFSTDDKSIPTGDDYTNLLTLYNKVSDKTINLESDNLHLLHTLKQLEIALDEYKANLAAASRTAKLWLQYMQYVSILRDFIRADRTSDWNLHLVCISKMIALFAATGHRHYAKSARLYLQMMLELPQTHPWLHEKLNSLSLQAVRRSNRYWAGLATDLVIEQVLMRAAKARGGLTHGRGMSESVRLMWIKSMHRCATVHSALTDLTNLQHVTNDVMHVELGKSRKKRDTADILKMVTWFQCHNPFSGTDDRLCSLSSGIAACAEDNINCDSADDVGLNILQQFDNVAFTDVVLKKSHQVRKLCDVSSSIVPGDKKLAVDSSVLFNRLIIIMCRSPNMESYFSHELSAIPTSLFKDTGLRKTDKSVLAKELLKLTASSTNCLQLASVKAYVVDGGWLLHKIKWQQGGTFGDVLEQYVVYVQQHFIGEVTVVFDGYGNGPTIKDCEHNRRSVKAAPDILFSDSTPAYSNQSSFLANDTNKNNFIKFLLVRLQLIGCKVFQASDDADTLIVKSALVVAEQGKHVYVVANDTDILVLLLYHYRQSMADVYMTSESKKQSADKVKIYPIRTIKSAMGSNVCNQLLTIHAVSGCDTTSALFALGKAGVYKKLSRNHSMLQLCQVIGSNTVSKDDVVAAGLQLMSFLYGGQPTDSLNRLRYLTFMNITATSSKQLRPERLPPTENAAKFHILRVHLQVLQWRNLTTGTFEPVEWGWRLVGDRYVPVATDLAPAPQDLMDVVRCKCRLESQRPCSSQLCSCVKHGVPCLAACKNCNGEMCDNAGESHNVDDSDVLDCEVSVEETLTEHDPDTFLEDLLVFDTPWLDEEVID